MASYKGDAAPAVIDRDTHTIVDEIQHLPGATAALIKHRESSTDST